MILGCADSCLGPTAGAPIGAQLQQYKLHSKQCCQLQSKTLQAHAFVPHTRLVCNAMRCSSGLVLSCTKARQHCIAMTMLLVQVLITGSEATENYIMQIFTPPYLTGKPCLEQ